MNWHKPLFSFLLLVTVFNLQSPDLAAKDAEQLTLESIFASDEFRSQTIENIQWHKNEKSFNFGRRNPDTGYLDVYEFNIQTKSTQLVLDNDQFSYAEIR